MTVQECFVFCNWRFLYGKGIHNWHTFLFLAYRDKNFKKNISGIVQFHFIRLSLVFKP
jgi:hypothetical protein